MVVGTVAATQCTEDEPMATAALHLRPRTHLSARDARAALAGVLAVAIIVFVLLIGTFAAAIPLQPDPAAYPTPAGGLDR
jgi:hypothetical protein